MRGRARTFDIVKALLKSIKYGKLWRARITNTLKENDALRRKRISKDSQFH